MELPVPPLTPYLFFADATAAIAFYKNAFGASQDGISHLMPGTERIMHARLLINGAMIMISDDFGPSRGEIAEDPISLGGSPIMLALQLDDAQAFWDRAVAGGATVTMPLAKMFWGDLYGQLTDPFGHKWSVSQTMGVMTDEDMQKAAEDAMAEKGTLMGEPAE